MSDGLLLLGLLLAAISGGEARASGLSVGMRIKQELYTPLVPVTKNFKTCFKTDSSGNQVMSICTTEVSAPPREEPQREPASEPRPKPSGKINRE